MTKEDASKMILEHIPELGDFEVLEVHQNEMSVDIRVLRAGFAFWLNLPLPDDDERGSSVLRRLLARLRERGAVRESAHWMEINGVPITDYFPGFGMTEPGMGRPGALAVLEVKPPADDADPR